MSLFILLFIVVLHSYLLHFLYLFWIPTLQYSLNIIFHSRKFQIVVNSIFFKPVTSLLEFFPRDPIWTTYSLHML